MRGSSRVPDGNSEMDPDPALGLPYRLSSQPHDVRPGCDDHIPGEPPPPIHEHEGRHLQGPQDEFSAVNVVELLDQDSRPTFVIDLDPDEAIGATQIVPVFCNTALRLHERLLDAIVGSRDGNGPDKDDDGYKAFSSWATGVTKFDDSKDVFPLSFMFFGMLWTGSTVRKRWRLISGNALGASPPTRDLSGVSAMASQPTPTIPHTPSRPVTAASTTEVATSGSAQQAQRHPFKTEQTSSESTALSSQSKRLVLAAPDRVCSDWTAAEPKGVLSAHVAYARTVAWENTPLGAMKQWTREFRQVVNLVMGNPYPAAVFYGPDLTMLYNEAYANEVAGNKHPSLMGTGFSGPFSELWDGVAAMFAECARTGVSIRKDDDYLPIQRHGLLEETFYSWSWTPLYGGTKQILGFYNAPFETTQSVLSQRRMKTINKLGGDLAHATTVKQFWKLILEGLEDNHFDVPFALLYSVGDSDDADQSSTSSGSTLSLKSCYCEGSIGIPHNHIARPPQLDLKRSREGFVPAFREAMRTREPTLLHRRDGTLPEELLEGINWRGFGDPCQQAIIFPVRPTNGDMVLAFLVVGVNPRRFYDDGYKEFTSMLNRQLATSLASCILYEEEVRKSRDAAEAAALEQEQLTQQLALQTSRLRRMTELSPLGMFLLTPEGLLREVNERYFEMTGLARDNICEMSWMEVVEDSSKAAMEKGWHQLVVERLPWSGELQLKKPGVQPVDFNGEAIDYWVLTNAQPEFASDNSLRSILGSITDISHLKWAQGLQNRRLLEAEEVRRQQNEFIDITSHEMRNPLSAILQCADDIISTLREETPPSPMAVESCLDAAHTISLCVQHQKSIVDDILTVSKLDSNLLVITPVISRPVEVVQRAVKMFDAELQAKDIQMVCEVHPSISELQVDWMTFDPSRVLQILINLITNAIKFTAASDKRVVTVSVGASHEPPLTVNGPEFRYIPTRLPSPPPMGGEDWGNGEVLYLRFSVQDTGCGLIPEEVKVLFERFSQASPRTHAQYGGSGLGLFISRQLSERHGGQVGVASVANVGSTFGFFVSARRSAAPEATSKSEHLVTTDVDFVSGATLPPHGQEPPTPSQVAGLIAARTAPQFDPRSLEILIVEDNLVNQTVLVKQLKKVGAGVSAANDGLEALAHLRETSYCQDQGRKLSVILMDLEMPNMDGLTCVREIRRLQQQGQVKGHVPVIAVTANVRDAQIATAMESGMDDVVSKPFRIPDLLVKIEATLARDSSASAA